MREELNPLMYLEWTRYSLEFLHCSIEKYSSLLLLSLSYTRYSSIRKEFLEEE